MRSTKLDSNIFANVQGAKKGGDSKKESSPTDTLNGSNAPKYNYLSPRFYLHYCWRIVFSLCFVYVNEMFVRSFLFINKMLFGKYVVLDSRLKRKRPIWFGRCKVVGLEKKYLEYKIETVQKIISPMAEEWENGIVPNSVVLLNRISEISKAV